MSLNAAEVAVVVLCWNGRTLLEQFLPSLVNNNEMGAEIIVADNGSADDSVDFVRSQFPSVTILQLEKNLGFAAGYNEAIRRISSPFIILINQDVAVTPRWIQPLMARMKASDRLGAVQPRILSYSQPLYFEYAGAAGGWIDLWGYPFCRGRVFDTVEKDEGQYNDRRKIFWASGACMLVRKPVYEELGGFDPEFFAHMEEIDLCWRMWNAGYEVEYCPDSTVYHLGGASLPQGHPYKVFLNFRNNLTMLAKNLPASQWWTVLPVRMLLDQLAALRSLLKGFPGDFLAVWKAHLQFLGSVSRIRRDRRGPQRKLRQLPGVYHGMLVWQYFLRRKKYFSQLVPASNPQDHPEF